MPETPTPGQVCYEAYRRVMMPAQGLPDGGIPWEWQGEQEQAAWEAAAQAVLTWQRPQQETTHEPA